jgi:hypothetical protein
LISNSLPSRDLDLVESGFFNGNNHLLCRWPQHLPRATLHGNRPGSPSIPKI